ncbi:hypothetical protein SHJG_6290 [Streptomyces hygroscopicus subsp. jinggangensis 5008]|nr:hypothetical protein SHJG_6290 [Streptomyces hygroscopicus subsp. jinggangensis 5008]AGF65714.1 hypothetical protein SHJGH_6051 [Streptomyces hygroscopicus subsp. jinggangensis TL01]
MVNHGTLCRVQTRGVHDGRRGTDQSVSATAPLPHRWVRRAPGGGRGAHVMCRSWWSCWRAGGHAREAVAAG